jgi:hypothetical protein
MRGGDETFLQWFDYKVNFLVDFDLKLQRLAVLPSIIARVSPHRDASGESL